MSQNNTPATDSNAILQKNRVYAPILVGLTLLFTVFFVYPAYTQYMTDATLVATLKKTQSESQKTLDDLKAMKANFSTNSGTINASIQKYTRPYVVSDIMETVMINAFTKPDAAGDLPIKIDSIDVGKGKKRPSGLSYATVGISVTATSIDTLVDYLTYLTTATPFALTINEISLPLDTKKELTELNSTSISLNMSLGLHFYDDSAPTEEKE